MSLQVTELHREGENSLHYSTRQKYSYCTQLSSALWQMYTKSVDKTTCSNSDQGIRNIVFQRSRPQVNRIVDRLDYCLKYVKLIQSYTVWWLSLSQKPLPSWNRNAQSRVGGVVFCRIIFFKLCPSERVWTSSETLQYSTTTSGTYESYLKNINARPTPEGITPEYRCRW